MPTGLDPSISLGVQVPQGTNPLQTAVEFARVQNMLNQNALFQQQFTANRAIGDVAQQAVDPNTGTIDWDKFAEIGSKDPRTAFVMPKILSEIQSRKLTQAQMTGQQLEQSHKVLDGIYGVLGNAALADDPGAAINAQLPAYIKSLPAPLQDKALAAAKDFISTAPQGADAQRRWLQPFLSAAKVGKDQVEAIMGTPTQVNAGGQIITQQTSPLTGVTRRSTTTPTTLAPTLTDVLTPEGGKQKVIMGGGASAPGPSGGAPGGGASGTPGLKSELPPSTTEYQKKSSEEVANMESDINGAVKAAIPVMKRLDAMQQAAGKFAAGGGITTRADIAQLVQAIGAPKEWVDKIAGGSLPAEQTFRALAGPLAIDTLKQVAQGTGRVMKSEVDTFLENNPNLSTDPDAIEKVFNFMRGVSKTYYDQQQGLAEFKRMPEVKGGSRPMSDFPAWYSQKLVTEGGLDFSDKTGVAKGATGTIEGAKPKGKKSVQDLKKEFGIQ